MSKPAKLHGHAQVVRPPAENVVWPASIVNSRYFTRIVGDSFCDYPDLFKFRFFKAKEFCHIDDLIRADEVRGVGAESLYAGSKLAALHGFGDLQTKAACAVRRAKQAEVTNNHFTSLNCKHPLRMTMDHSPYAIRE